MFAIISIVVVCTFSLLSFVAVTQNQEYKDDAIIEKALNDGYIPSRQQYRDLMRNTDEVRAAYERRERRLKARNLESLQASRRRDEIALYSDNRPCMT